MTASAMLPGYPFRRRTDHGSDRKCGKGKAALPVSECVDPGLKLAGVDQ